MRHHAQGPRQRRGIVAGLTIVLGLSAGAAHADDSPAAQPGQTAVPVAAPPPEPPGLLAGKPPAVPHVPTISWRKRRFAAAPA